MRALSDVEKISLAAILKMESDGVVMQRAINALISDDDLKRQSEAGILAAEGRIKGVFKLGDAWAIPEDAEKPIDARTTRESKND